MVSTEAFVCIPIFRSVSAIFLFSLWLKELNRQSLNSWNRMSVGDVHPIKTDAMMTSFGWRSLAFSLFLFLLQVLATNGSSYREAAAAHKWACATCMNVKLKSPNARLPVISLIRWFPFHSGTSPILRYDELKPFENFYERAKHYLKEYHHESGRTFSQPQIQPK
jgi:hypothetical protein